MQTETLTRPKSEVLKEIRSALIAVFELIGYKNFVHYKITKENHLSSHFDITIIGDKSTIKKEVVWKEMREIIMSEFENISEYKILDDHFEQVRLWVTRECELRQNQPKKEIVVEIEEVVEVMTEQLPPPPLLPVVKIEKPNPAPVAQLHKQKVEVKPSMFLRSTKKGKAIYDKKILADMYRTIYMSLQKEAKLKLGGDFSLSNPDGSSLELKFVPSQSNYGLSVAERVSKARIHFETKFNSNATAPYFSIVLGKDSVHEEIIVLNVADEYHRRCETK